MKVSCFRLLIIFLFFIIITVALPFHDDCIHLEWFFLQLLKLLLLFNYFISLIQSQWPGALTVCSNSASILGASYKHAFHRLNQPKCHYRSKLRPHPVHCSVQLEKQKEQWQFTSVDVAGFYLNKMANVILHIGMQLKQRSISKTLTQKSI